MAVVGILANPLSVGAINTSASATLTHNFGPSSIWAHSSLTKVDDDDDGGCTTFVSKFVDASGPHNVAFVGVFANNCTSVTYKLAVTDCIAAALCITEFFG